LRRGAGRADGPAGAEKHRPDAVQPSPEANPRGGAQPPQQRRWDKERRALAERHQLEQLGRVEAPDGGSTCDAPRPMNGRLNRPDAWLSAAT